MAINPVTLPPPGEQAPEALLRQRYRDFAPPPGSWNAVVDLLLSHRSVRAYRPDPLPPGTLETLVAAAQSAATSSNLQPWSVVAVTDPARKERLSHLAGDQKHIRDAPLFLLWLVDLHRLDEIGAAESIPAQATDYLESFLLGAVDTSLAAQNAVVALESLGLGSVYIGGIRNRPVEVAAELGLPPHCFALFGLTVGYADPAAPASVKPRLPQRAVLFHEQYGTGGEIHGGVADYNASLKSFQAEQGLAGRNWSAVVAQRLRGPEALHGRDKLVDALQALGFKLR